jgi:hypothetical protein
VKTRIRASSPLALAIAEMQGSRACRRDFAFLAFMHEVLVNGLCNRRHPAANAASPQVETSAATVAEPAAPRRPAVAVTRRVVDARRNIDNNIDSDRAGPCRRGRGGIESAIGAPA